MRLNWKWIQRRWYEFRMGDSGYLRYLINFGQFIILAYALGIERWSWLEAIFTSMSIFAVTFFCFYVPISILIGHYLHRKKQMISESIIATEQNPVIAYYTYVTMLQGKLFYDKVNLPVSPEYLKMMEYWKKIAGDWSP